jgi:hypothetical protein
VIQQRALRLSTSNAWPNTASPSRRPPALPRFRIKNRFDWNRRRSHRQRSPGQCPLHNPQCHLDFRPVPRLRAPLPRVTVHDAIDLPGQIWAIRIFISKFFRAPLLGRVLALLHVLIRGCERPIRGYDCVSTFRAFYSPVPHGIAFLAMTRRVTAGPGLATTHRLGRVMTERFLSKNRSARRLPDVCIHTTKMGDHPPWPN